MLSTHVNTKNTWQLEGTFISQATAHIPYMHVGERVIPITSVHMYACTKKLGIIVSVPDLLLLHTAWPSINWPAEPRLTHVHALHQVPALQFLKATCTSSL